MKIHLHIKHALCAIAISLLSLASTSAQTAASLIEQGTKLLTESYGDRDSQKCKESLRLLQQACDLDKSSSEARFELGQAYIFARFIDLSLANIKKGYKLINEAADMGNIYAAIYLFDNPVVKNISDYGLPKNWNKYKLKYAPKVLSAEIPADFKDYLKLSEAAKYLYNSHYTDKDSAIKDKYGAIADKYGAIAVDNDESGAIDHIMLLSIKANFLVKSPKAQFDIATKLWRRGFDAANDGEMGFYLFEKSAEAGYAKAQHQMGYMLWNGYFVEKDSVQGVEWFKKAADNNEPRALFAMAQLYANGKFVPQDSVKAFESYKRCYELGSDDSAWKLALCYLNGFGTEPDQAKVRELIEPLRGKYNNVDYVKALSYYNELSPKAVELFEQCTKDSKLPDSQRSDALRKLSACYRFGRCGVTTDPDKADALLKEAATYGDQEATDVLQFLNMK